VELSLPTAEAALNQLGFPQEARKRLLGLLPPIETEEAPIDGQRTAAHAAGLAALHRFLEGGGGRWEARYLPDLEGGLRELEGTGFRLPAKGPGLLVVRPPTREALAFALTPHGRWHLVAALALPEGTPLPGQRIRRVRGLGELDQITPAFLERGGRPAATEALVGESEARTIARLAYDEAVREMPPSVRELWERHELGDLDAVVRGAVEFLTEAEIPEHPEAPLTLPIREAASRVAREVIRQAAMPAFIATDAARLYRVGRLGEFFPEDPGRPGVLAAVPLPTRPEANLREVLRVGPLRLQLGRSGERILVIPFFLETTPEGEELLASGASRVLGSWREFAGRVRALGGEVFQARTPGEILEAIRKPPRGAGRRGPTYPSRG